MTEFLAFVQFAVEVRIANAFANATASAAFSVACVFSAIDQFGAFEAAGEKIGGAGNSFVLHLPALASLDRSFSAFTAGAFVASENAFVVTRIQFLIASQATRHRNFFIARLFDLRFSAEAIARLRSRTDATWLTRGMAHFLATMITARQQSPTLLFARE